ncbi:hypothetical protein KUCAC02_001283, partial [Chaenocephalus aceratus]
MKRYLPTPPPHPSLPPGPPKAGSPRNWDPLVTPCCSPMSLGSDLLTCLELERYLQTEPKRLHAHLPEPPSPPPVILCPTRKISLLRCNEKDLKPKGQGLENVEAMEGVTRPAERRHLPDAPLVARTGRHLFKPIQTLTASADGTLTLKLVARKAGLSAARLVAAHSLPVRMKDEEEGAACVIGVGELPENKRGSIAVNSTAAGSYIISKWSYGDFQPGSSEDTSPTRAGHLIHLQVLLETEGGGFSRYNSFALPSQSQTTQTPVEELSLCLSNCAVMDGLTWIGYHFPALFQALPSSVPFCT